MRQKYEDEKASLERKYKEAKVSAVLHGQR